MTDQNTRMPLVPARALHVSRTYESTFIFKFTVHVVWTDWLVSWMVGQTDSHLTLYIYRLALFLLVLAECGSLTALMATSEFWALGHDFVVPPTKR